MTHSWTKPSNSRVQSPPLCCRVCIDELWIFPLIHEFVLSSILILINGSVNFIHASFILARLCSEMWGHHMVLLSALLMQSDGPLHPCCLCVSAGSASVSGINWLRFKCAGVCFHWPDRVQRCGTHRGLLPPRDEGGIAGGLSFYCWLPNKYTFSFSERR